MADRGIVAVFGSMNMDLSVACERMPRAGETVGGSGFITNAGGKGANQAVAAARMGARTCMIGAVGRDSFGDTLVAGLQDAGVGVEFVAHRDDAETGTATIIRCEGDNRIVLSPGANHALTGENVACALRCLVADELDGNVGELAPAAGSVFVVQGECDLMATAAALSCAHGLGFYTVFNPAPACNLPAEAWPAVDLVCPNETECQALTGILPTDDESCVAALNALLAKGAGAAVITLGGAGSVTLGDDGELLRMPALSSAVVDTTAAGDTFIGALAAARLEGLPLFECMAAGARASAVTVSRLGAQQSIPTRAEVEHWFGQTIKTEKRSRTMATKKLILDLDMGVDDAMALAYAIASPEVELVGITTCFGNVRVEQSAHNCLAVLDLLGRPEVPVYLGADRPIKATEPYTPPASTTLIHGKNGIGGASVPASPYEPVGATSADGNAAVDYLIDAARTYGPDLVYVATGPLSNLALALERDAAAMMSIGRVVVMGGALTVPGNVSAGAEANMASDPEAADVVLRSGRKLTMVGLDVTHRVVLTRRDIAGWTGSGTMAGCAYASMVEHYIGSYEMNAPYLGGCALHDPLAVAVAIDPTLVGALGCNLRVDLLGEYRGRTICDERRVADPDKSALVALTVDAPRFLSEFKTRMARVLG